MGGGNPFPKYPSPSTSSTKTRLSVERGGGQWWFLQPHALGFGLWDLCPVSVSHTPAKTTRWEESKFHILCPS